VVQKITNAQRVVDMDIRRRDQLIERIASHLKRWDLVAPGVVVLETNKPFSFLGSQLILFLQPVLTAFMSPEAITDYVSLLEDRDNVERLIQKLETDVVSPTGGDAPWR
jgi:hypothetical protein